MRNGAPGEIRTPDPLVRSQMLYPAELRAPSTIVTHTHLKSHECAPAIDNDYLPGHEVRRREIRDSARDVLSRACAMQRDAPDVFFIGRLAGKLNRAGRDAVHQNLG